MERIPKHAYYLGIAGAVALRGTCIRRNYGAVIVKDDQIVGTGYTGSPRGAVNCCDVGTCKREEIGAKPGERYELCESVHAEMNAIISAGRLQTINAVLYLVGLDYKTGAVLDTFPCKLCTRVIINAGIASVILPHIGEEGEDNAIRIYTPPFS